MAEHSFLTRQLGAAPELRLPSITIGNSDFPMIRRSGFLFVDKTAKLPLLLKYKKVFVARPRRFGKTTLASMLFELFMHGTEQFEGLAVYDTWPETQCYPVMSISLYGRADPKTFEASLCLSLCGALAAAGLPELKERAQGITDIDAFFSTIGYELSSHRTVWLIDEVGCPLEANLDHRLAFEANAEVLHKFFAHLRQLRNVRYLFVTGILRYQPGRAGLLLPGQDIVNISMNPAFADLLGYTQTELETNFAPYIERAAQLLGLSRVDFLEKLKLKYGGFCFDEDTSAALYCPWSINKFFQQVVTTLGYKPSFDNFWMNSAGAAHALRPFLKARPTDLTFLEQALSAQLPVAVEDFNAPSEFEQLDLTSILVQAGYLGLKQLPAAEANFARECGVYPCGFPNLEVAAPFAAVAVSVPLSDQLGPSNFKQVKDVLWRAWAAQDMAAMVGALNVLLACIDPDEATAWTVGQYRTFMSLCLRTAYLGCAVPTATDISQGRSDIELKADDSLLVIELKRLPADAGGQKACLALAQEAQDQLLGRSYGPSEGEKRHAVVLVLSAQESQIVYWRLLSLEQAEQQEPLRGEGWVEPWPLAVSKAAAASGAAAPLINPILLQAALSLAQQLTARAYRVATLDPTMLARGLQSLAAILHEQKLTFSEEQIEDYLDRYLEQIHKVSLPEQAQTFDADYLERQLVALLTKVCEVAAAADGDLPQDQHPALESKTRPALTPLSIKAILALSQPRAESKDIVTLNEEGFIAGVMAVVADLGKPEVNYSAAEIKSLVQLATNVAQTIKPPKLITVDRAFLVQTLVDLLTISS